MTGDEAKQKLHSLLPASSQTLLPRIMRAEPQFSRLGARDMGGLQRPSWAGHLVCYKQQTSSTSLLPTPQPPRVRQSALSPQTPATPLPLPRQKRAGRVRPDIRSKQCLMSALHLLN